MVPFGAVRRLLLCAAALLGACSEGGREPLAVVARLGDAGPVEELRLSSETRPAVCPAAGAPIRLEPDAPLRRLLLSVGVKAGGGAAAQRFAVVETSGGAERVLLEASVPTGEPRWHDHAIELGERGGARSFELRGDGDAAPYWLCGSLGDHTPADAQRVEYLTALEVQRML